MDPTKPRKPLAMPTLSYAPTQPQPVAQPAAPSKLAAQPPTGYVNQTQINPAADLRSQQISPTGGAYAAKADDYGLAAADSLGTGKVATSDYSKLQSMIDRITGSVGSAPGYAPSADTNALRQSYLDSIKGLQGPDRSKLASDAFSLMREESEPGFQEALRSVNRSSAAMGRQGAGMTTNDLGTVAQRREEALARAQKGLAGEAAGLTLDDRLKVASGTGEGYDRIANQDLSSTVARQNAWGGGMDALTRGLDYQFDLEGLKRGEGESDRAYGLNRSGSFAGLSDRAFDQGSRRRDEFRDERDYQTDANQRGIDNAVKQTELEDYLLNSEFGRNSDELDQTYRLGYNNNPDATYRDVAGHESDQAEAGYEGAGDLLSEFLAQQAGRPKVARRPSAPILPNWEEDQ
jgi:hypothetical protein